MATVYGYGTRQSSAACAGSPQVATFVVDFDAIAFEDSAGSAKPEAYTSGDAVALIPAPAGDKAIVVFGASYIMNTASTAATSSTILVGADGADNTAIGADINGKTATTFTVATTAAPVSMGKGKFLGIKNTLVGAGVKGKITVSVMYAVI